MFGIIDNFYFRLQFVQFNVKHGTDTSDGSSSTI